MGGLLEYFLKERVCVMLSLTSARAHNADDSSRLICMTFDFICAGQQREQPPWCECTLGSKLVYTKHISLLFALMICADRFIVSWWERKGNTRGRVWCVRLRRRMYVNTNLWSFHFLLTPTDSNAALSPEIFFLVLIIYNCLANLSNFRYAFRSKL